MNKLDKNPDYKKIYAFVVGRFQKTKHFKYGPFDETYYSLRVYETAKNIIKLLKKQVNVEQILVAAILHDVGKSKLSNKFLFTKSHGEEWYKHPKLGVEIARKFLIKSNYSQEFITGVLYLIENHDNRGKLMTKRTLELKILQDADLISDCGMAAFIRPFLYSGKFERAVIETINYLRNVENRVLGNGMLNLKISKKMAKDKILLERKLISLVSKDIESDLL